jgi:hypothetical protein
MRIQPFDISAPEFTALPLPTRAPLPSTPVLFLRELWLITRVISLLALALVICGGAGGLGILTVIELILSPTP